MSTHRLRIGEVARRSGVPVELLRAWERRYGVPSPDRSPSGFRLYPEDEVARVAQMRALVASGVAPSEAARAVAAEPAAGEDPAGAAAARQAVLAAVRAFDEAALQATLDRLLATLTVEAVLSEVVLPVLHDLGDGWERGDVSVAEEHFASQVLRGRLLGLARGWSRGGGPVALLACPPGEQHDLGLIAFGIALNRLGWRIAFIGPDTPFDTLAGAAAAVRADVVVLALTWGDNRVDAEAVRTLAREHRVVLAGRRAAEVAEAAGVTALDADPLVAAERLAGTLGG